MKAYNRIMEYFWLFVAITSAALGIFMTFEHSWEDGKYFYIATAMSTLLYLMRRFYRKTVERQSKDGE
tara:strand:- start:1485 stop:1688 length:204 start_codon:yes stop_codon:yes gene_type:complete